MGSVSSSARAQGLLLPPILGMIAISGIFYPVTSLPVWLRWVSRVFPVYWLGLVPAPVVLRRTVRRESGSGVARWREKSLQRVG